MICKNCGVELNSDMDFCYACGSAVDSKISQQNNISSSENSQNELPSVPFQASVEMKEKKKPKKNIMGIVISVVAVTVAMITSKFLVPYIMRGGKTEIESDVSSHKEEIEESFESSMNMMYPSFGGADVEISADDNDIVYDVTFPELKGLQTKEREELAQNIKNSSQSMVDLNASLIRDSYSKLDSVTINYYDGNNELLCTIVGE